MKTSEEETKTAVYLDPDEAMLFVAFQKNYRTVAHILGSIDALGLNSISNASLTMDFDRDGIISHTSITKHYRK